MSTPLISVVMPARNEVDRLAGTIRSIASTRSRDFELEIIIVDDASTDGCCSDLVYESKNLVAPGLAVRVYRFTEQVGVPIARNQGVRISRGEIVFITDAHVRFTSNWDSLVMQHISDDRILAATIVDPTSEFKGFGCDLVVPFMGTQWKKRSPGEVTPVQIASCAGTVLTRRLFDRIGGYDSGMIRYSGAEPEFSVRAWRSGAEIVSVPDLEVAHRFKPRGERERLLPSLSSLMVHNCLRFGTLHLSEPAILQMMRYFGLTYTEEFPVACRLLEESDVWERRGILAETLPYDFAWFVDRFDLRDQCGGKILDDPVLPVR